MQTSDLTWAVKRLCKTYSKAWSSPCSFVTAQEMNFLEFPFSCSALFRSTADQQQWVTAGGSAGNTASESKETEAWRNKTVVLQATKQQPCFTRKCLRFPSWFSLHIAFQYKASEHVILPSLMWRVHPIITASPTTSLTCQSPTERIWTWDSHTPGDSLVTTSSIH